MSNEVKILGGLGIVTVALVVLLAVFFGGSTNPGTSTIKPTAAQLVPTDAYQTGPKDAKVTVVEFGDFQCPACGAEAPIVKDLRSEYAGKVNFVFRHFPLSIHPNAQVGAEAAEAAGAQGKFWEMYDLLYANQSQWVDSSDPVSFFVTYAQSLGLNTTTFKSDVDNYKYVTKIRRDMADGTAIGVSATPTFYVNGVQYVGDMPLSNFQSVINQDLGK